MQTEKSGIRELERVSVVQQQDLAQRETTAVVPLLEVAAAPTLHQEAVAAQVEAAEAVEAIAEEAEAAAQAVAAEAEVADKHRDGLSPSLVKC